MNTSAMDQNFWGEPIHTYSRAQALADGVLVAADAQLAKESGMKCAVAYTAAAFADAVAWDDETAARKPGTGQSRTGREWDVLSLFRFAAARADRGASRIQFDLCRVPAEGSDTEARTITLVATIGGGDKGEPVVTLMQPHED